ncbi:HEPN domain-containing protein [Methanobacterium aggregans]|uniref:HEPN domain-containing protein n=1 Tax=Methanobacterium aggregans TaxID=1615586 RepID=UPI001AE1807F|nr:HEPN domain-containing protein [Methanobacterium aggregans]MBP2045190.1 hypothetical protein [Methanobacterium aggregans]
MFEELMDKYVAISVAGINTNQDINFTENIQLKKSDEPELTCIRFTLNGKCLDIIGESIPKEILRKNKSCEWESLPLELLEEYVEDYLMDEGFFQITKLVDAINICKKEPCQIYEQFFYDGFSVSDDIWEKPSEKFFHEIQGCTIEKKDLGVILPIWKRLLDSYDEFPNFNYKKYWWLIASEYFERYPNSSFISDQLIDLMIALESLLSGHNDKSEMRYRFSQRSSLFLFHKYQLNPKQIQKIVKEMYDMRSKIVHGSASLRSSETEFIKIEGNKISLDHAVNILREIVRLILFEAILKYSNISKDKFLEEIDSIWFNDKDNSKIKPVNY